VAWLSLGTVELLFPAGIARTGYRGFVLAVSLVGLISVSLAPLHSIHLATIENPINCTIWCKGESGFGTLNLLAFLSALVSNIIGTIVLVGGAAYSAYRTYRAGLPRNLTFGNVLIVLGALIVASAGSATLLGSYDYFYAAQAAGIAVIYGGFQLIGSVSSQARSQPA
jgi:hypothetical protein